jgi:two-component system, response regulator RegA
MENLEDYPSLLLVDDDDTFRSVLADALSKRNFLVSTAHNVESAIQLAESNPPEYAIVDLKMPGASGLELIKNLKALDDATLIVVLTGYASIATAVEAIKLGATYYLSKPANADDIVAAFYKSEGNVKTPLAHAPLSVDRVEWEHIQRVLQQNNGNISATARNLNMHRRTLQRKLAKYPCKQ